MRDGANPCFTENLLECIRLVKKEGCQAGFVTSGIGLTRERMSGLIEAGLDLVGFSVSGTTPETHDGIRVNSHLPKLIETIRMFQEEKSKRNLLRPKFHMVFLMVKENIREVPEVPAFAKEIGIEEVVLTNICHMINTWQEKQRVFVWEERESDYEALVKQAETNARRLKIKLSRPSLSSRDVAVCDENPLRNLYISAEGEVSPCVYLFPALPSPFRRIFCSKEYWVDRVSFGNVFETPFPAIWNGDDYKQFRDRFSERQKRLKDLYYSLWGDARMKDVQKNVLPAPPEPCQDLPQDPRHLSGPHKKRAWRDPPGPSCFRGLKLGNREEHPAEDEIRKQQRPDDIEGLRDQEGRRRLPAAHGDEILELRLKPDTQEGHREPPAP